MDEFERELIGIALQVQQRASTQEIFITGTLSVTGGLFGSAIACFHNPPDNPTDALAAIAFPTLGILAGISIALLRSKCNGSNR